MTAPYYRDESVTLYHGDCREIAAGLTADCVVADPPYGETSLSWDRWPDGWPAVMVDVAKSMWCFGSMRMFLDRRDEFAGWKLSQDVVWEKHNGSGFDADRFKRVHEIVAHWYRGNWSGLHRDVPKVWVDERQRTRHALRASGEHRAEIPGIRYDYDGSRLARSVLTVRSMHGRAMHPTEKPVGILDPLIRYTCPPGGTVLDPFAGSGSTGEAARLSGRRAILIEADERYCELIVRRLAQQVLELP